LRRGDVWWAEFGVPFGSEPGSRRPVVVVQSDPFNRSALSTVLVVPLTTSLALAAAPGNVRCGPRDTGLPRASVANVSQVSVIDRRRLRDRVASVPGRLMQRIDEGLRLVLAL
jgi:mRNA interferase MazF